MELEIVPAIPRPRTSAVRRALILRTVVESINTAALGLPANARWWGRYLFNGWHDGTRALIRCDGSRFLALCFDRESTRDPFTMRNRAVGALPWPVHEVLPTDILPLFSGPMVEAFDLNAGLDPDEEPVFGGGPAPIITAAFWGRDDDPVESATPWDEEWTHAGFVFHDLLLTPGAGFESWADEYYGLSPEETALTLDWYARRLAAHDLPLRLKPADLAAFQRVAEQRIATMLAWPRPDTLPPLALPSETHRRRYLETARRLLLHAGIAL